MYFFSIMYASNIIHICMNILKLQDLKQFYYMWPYDAGPTSEFVCEPRWTIIYGTHCIFLKKNLQILFQAFFKMYCYSSWFFSSIYHYTMLFLIIFFGFFIYINLILHDLIQLFIISLFLYDPWTGIIYTEHLKTRKFSRKKTIV